MSRTREAALHGAVAAVAKYGSRKATMGDIAMLAGIAKATLYNHFRTRDDVFRAAVEFEVDAVARAALLRSADGIAAVIEEAARLVAEHPAVRRISRDEPAVLAALASIVDTPAWIAARGHVAAALSGAGTPADRQPPGGDLVLRYLASQLLSPSAADERRSAAALLGGLLTAAPQD